MKDDFRVGFVGVGRMGANMARCLKDKDYDVTAVYDLDSQRSRALAEELSAARRLHRPLASLNGRTRSSPSSRTTRR